LSFFNFGHFKMSKIAKNELNFFFEVVLFCRLLQSVVKKMEIFLKQALHRLKKGTKYVQ